MAREGAGTPRPREGSGRVLVVAMAMLAGAAAATIAAEELASPPPGSFALPLVGWAAAFALAEWSVANLEVRGHVISHSVVEIVSAAALLFASPLTFVVARAGANTLTQARRRSEPVRLAFNGALFAFEASVASLVFHAATSAANVEGPRGWAASVVAIAVAGVISASCIAVAMAVTGSRGHVPDLAGQLVAVAPLTLVLSVVGTTGAQLVVRDGRAAWLLGLIALLMWQLLRTMAGYVRNIGTLRGFHEHTARLQAAATPTQVVEVAIDAVHALTGCRWAEVLGPGMEEPLQSSRGGLGGFGEATRHAEELDDVVQPRRLTTVESTVRASTHGEVVPLRRDHQVIGYLAAGFGDNVTAVPETRQTLLTVARQVEAALLRSQLAKDLRAEVAARAHRALHDGLTGLPNRANLLQTLDRVTVGRRDGDASVALLVVVLSRFSEVTDTLGHDQGDGVLLMASERLSGALRQQDVLTRLEGATFGVVAPGVGRMEAMEVARRLRARLMPVFELDGLRLDIGAHVGVAMASDHGPTGATLLRAAERARDLAATEPGGVATFVDDDGQAVRRLSIAAELRLAAPRGHVRPWYQPKIDVATGRVHGVEALARWRHEDLGDVAPSEFIPIAEQSGAIVAVTVSVLDQALTHAAMWREMGHDLDVAVNLSPRVLMEDDAVGLVRRVIDRHDVARERLTLEVTESMFVAGDHAEDVIRAIRDLGVRLSIDDYGTGYSSLGYLHRLEVDELKIDRSFLIELDREPARRTVLGSTVDLAHALGISVVAEGVEDTASVLALRAMGCDLMQGFAAARPMAAEELTRWLSSLPDHRWQPTLDARDDPIIV